MHRFGLGPDHSDPSAVCVHILKKPESARPTSSHLYSRRASNVTRSRDDSYDTDYIAREFPFARQSDSKNPYNRKYFRPRYKLIPSGKKQRDNAVTNAAQGILLPTRSNFRTTPKVRKSPESSARCLSEEDPVKKTRKKISGFFTGHRVCGLPASPDARPAKPTSSFSGQPARERVLHTIAGGSFIYKRPSFFDVFEFIRIVIKVRFRLIFNWR